jgi:hypothetical protein
MRQGRSDGFGLVVDEHGRPGGDPDPATSRGVIRPCDLRHCAGSTGVNKPASTAEMDRDGEGEDGAAKVRRRSRNGTRAARQRDRLGVQRRIAR